MKIGEEIIKMYGKRIGKDTTFKGKVQEANFLEAGERLAAGNLPKRNIIIDTGGRRSGMERLPICNPPPGKKILRRQKDQVGSQKRN